MIAMDSIALASPATNTQQADLALYDALYSRPGVRHVLVRHEQAAVHAAEGYARSTGRVGVVLVTSGPGAGNTITGLRDAMSDSIPILCISGQVATAPA